MKSGSDKNNTVQMAEELYHDVVALANAHPDNPRLRHDTAHAALHLVSIYAGKKELEKAAKIYNEISKLVDEFPEEVNLRATKGQAAVWFSGHLGDVGEVDKARGIYDDLKKLLDRFPDDADLRESVGHVAFNLSLDYWVARPTQLKPLQEIYADVTQLCEKFSDHVDLQIDRARIATNLIAAYAEAGDLKTAHDLYRGIAALAATHPDQMAFREAQSAGAVSLIAQIDELEG
jgi:tetratricopeptide (TPR) repeat protein